MLQILSSLTLLTRMDLEASAWVLASGVTGTFVAFGGSDDVVKPTLGDFAVPIWSESKRDGSAGFSPDVHSTGNVTVMYGKLRGLTDQFSTSPSSPAAGEALSVSATGKLKVKESSETVVAYCTKPAGSVTYLGTTYSAIEFVTV